MKQILLGILFVLTTCGYGQSSFFWSHNNSTQPTVTTTNIIAVKGTTASSGGNVSTIGNNDTITSRGICWSTASNPTIADSKTIDGTGQGIFTSSITGLLVNTTYYVRAYATNSGGTIYGNQISFNSGFAIGYFYEGGLVFYNDGNGKGLVCTPLEIGTGYSQWGCSGTEIIGADGTAIGTGYQNTVDIVNGCSDAQSAARVCYDLVLNGYNDWFLPSKDELNELAFNIPIASSLWSSSEYSAIDAWYITSTKIWTHTKFQFPSTYLPGKTETNYIRAVRTFSGITSPPILTTNSISSLTSTSAVCGGNVTNDGGSFVTARGVCWSTTANPTITDSKTSDGSGIGSFSSNITGLTPATTYHVRAYATYSKGTTYGQDVLFVTGGAVPTVTTNTATNVFRNSAILNATVNANFLSSVVTFEYGLNTSYGSISTANQSPISESINTNASVNITGLTPSTSYHYRVKAVNSIGTTYGNDMTFTTSTSFSIGEPFQGGIIFYLTDTYPNQQGLICAPSNQSEGIQWYNGNSIATGATEIIIGSGQANTNKIVSTQGTGNYAAKICDDLILNGHSDWFLPSKEELYQMYINLKLKSLGNLGNYNYWSSSEFDFQSAFFMNFYDGSSTIDNKGNTYYVRAIRKIQNLSVTTNNPTSITSTSAVSGGNILFDGEFTVIARGVCWSTNANPTIEDTKTNDGDGIGTFSSTINGLTAGSIYHIRAYATNVLGTYYGTDISFITLGAPVVTTKPASGITNESTQLNGAINPNGLSTTIIFEYGLTSDYGNIVTATQSPLVDGSNISVSAVVSGLSSGATYHYRVKAINSLGTAYGGDMTFTTKITSIGATYAGGIVFYLDETGLHGLVCTSSDQSTGIQWSNGSSIVTGATSTAVGTGQLNTSKIIAAQGVGSYAAKICDDLVLNGYSDWFLPSKDELNLIYSNLKVNGLGGFGVKIYWSSSEYNSTDVWVQSFSGGTQSYGYKPSSVPLVRAIRVF